MSCSAGWPCEAAIKAILVAARSGKDHLRRAGAETLSSWSNESVQGPKDVRLSKQACVRPDSFLLLRGASTLTLYSLLKLFTVSVNGSVMSAILIAQSAYS